jgi:hypothetical protein
MAGLLSEQPHATGETIADGIAGTSCEHADRRGLGPAGSGQWACDTNPRSEAPLSPWLPWPEEPKLYGTSERGLV